MHCPKVPHCLLHDCDVSYSEFLVLVSFKTLQELLHLCFSSLMEASEIPLYYVFSIAYYLLLVVCEWSHERRIASCIVLVALFQYLLNSFVVHAYIHLMKQKNLSKFSLSRLVRWTEFLEDKQYAKLGGVDTSQTYLIFQKLLLLFLPHSFMIWTKLTRTDAVFSRAASMVLLCAGLWIFRCVRKFAENPRTRSFY